MGVGFEVVETVAIPDAVVVDVFPTVCADGQGVAHGEIPFPVVFVDEVLSPVVRAVAFDEGKEGVTIHLGGVHGLPNAGELEHAGAMSTLRTMGVMVVPGG